MKGPIPIAMSTPRAQRRATWLTTLLLAGSLATAQPFTYLAVGEHPTLDQAEQQLTTLDVGAPTLVLSESQPVPGFESINVRQEVYRVLIGPLEGPELTSTREALEDLGLPASVFTYHAPVHETRYQVQLGSYRSAAHATAARDALEALGEPAFTIQADPFTFVHAGPYDTREDADAALDRIRAGGVGANLILGTLTPEHHLLFNFPTAPNAVPSTNPSEAATTHASNSEPAAEVVAPVTQPALPERQPEPVAALVGVQLHTSLPNFDAGTFLHVTSSHDAADLEALRAMLEGYRLPTVTLDHGRYRLFVGPLADADVEIVKRLLRQQDPTTVPFVASNDRGAPPRLERATPQAEQPETPTATPAPIDALVPTDTQPSSTQPASDTVKGEQGGEEPENQPLAQESTPEPAATSEPAVVEVEVDAVPAPTPAVQASVTPPTPEPQAEVEAEAEHDAPLTLDEIPAASTRHDPEPTRASEAEPVTVTPAEASAIDTDVDAGTAAEAGPEAEVDAEVEVEPSGPTYLHVAAHADPEALRDDHQRMRDLGHDPLLLEHTGRYRLYIGPYDTNESHDLRVELRTHGIAAFESPNPAGEPFDLPEPAPTVLATNDAPATADEAEATEAATADDVIADAPIAPTTDAAAPDTPASTPDPRTNADATDSDEPTVNAAHEVVAEENAADTDIEAKAAWAPEDPIGRLSDLPNGVFFIIKTKDTVPELEEAHHDMLALEHPTTVVGIGDRYALLAGPFADEEHEEIRVNLRRRGIAAITTHNPAYQPPSLTPLIDLAGAQSPRNYLRIDVGDDTTLEQALATLTRQDAPAFTLEQDDTPILLVGPIENDQLETTAENLQEHGTITLHPMPAPPNADADADAWAQHGYDLLTHHAPNAARQAFLEARATNVTHYDALFGLALTEDHLGNDDAAEFAYQYVMNTHPERFDARYNYALRTHRLHGPNEALPHYQQALSLASNLPTQTREEAHVALAGVLTDLGDHQGATEQYQQAYALTQNIDHLVERFRAQRAQGQSLPLLPELTALERSTNDVRFTTLIAGIYTSETQHAYAIDTLTRRLEHAESPTDTTYLLNARAAVHAAKGNHQAARDDLTTALEHTPEDATTHHNLGLVHLAQSRHADAIEHIQEAITLGLQDPLAHLDLAEAATRANDPSLTLASTTSALEALTTPAPRARALFLHAQAQQANGQHAESRDALTELLTLTPDDPRALTLAGVAAYHAGEYGLAAEHLEHAFSLTGDASQHAALANAYLAAERYFDAERTLRTILDTRPEDADALHKLGWALLHLDNPDAAKTAWRDALAHGHDLARADLERIFHETN